MTTGRRWYLLAYDRDRADWPMEARRYAAMVTMVDRQVGEILAVLKELGLEVDRGAGQGTGGAQLGVQDVDRDNSPVTWLRRRTATNSIKTLSSTSQSGGATTITDSGTFTADASTVGKLIIGGVLLIKD